MNVNNALRPFIRRLRLEAALKATATGLMLGVAAGFFLLIAAHLWMQPDFPYREWACIVVLISLIAAVLVYMVWTRPTPEQAAKRIDRLGLQEKVSTMVNYHKSDAYLHRVQREDAMQALSACSPKQIRIKLPVRQLIVCGVLACLCVSTILLPWEILR